MKYFLLLVTYFLCIFVSSCESGDSNNNTYSPIQSNYRSQKYEDKDDEEITDVENQVTENKNNDEDVDEEILTNGCKYNDGTYTATVYYSNDETGFSNTYTLDVEVEDCEVIQINFPNGGWLDDDHIIPAELDQSGNCTIYGEKGKTYEIELD